MQSIFLPHGIQMTFMDDSDVGTISDGYHTFNELYEHRCLLYCLAVRNNRLAWKSKLHSDGTMYEGWFISGLTVLSQGEFKNITYHLPLSLWDLCKVKELDKAPEFDGCDSFGVLNRLRDELSHGLRK